MPPDHAAGDAGVTLPPIPLEDSAPHGAIGRSSALKAGTVLGAYRLIDTLGAGAMGIVYLAEHVKLGRRVAIKTLRSEYSNDASQVSRFFAEARAVNQIAHENIIEVTDFVEASDGPSYFVMELLRGTTLEDELQREKCLAPARVIAIGLQTCGALDAVHAAGIVHRDLKPENLFLIERGGRKDFVKLLDFGIAKLMDAEARGVKSTAAGTMLGTPQYMSPEQATGNGPDHRADIYALGVMLYEMLAGRPPFEAKTIGEVILKHLGEVPLPPSVAGDRRSEVTPALDAVVLRCLEKSPGRRYQTMAEVAAALRALQATQDWVPGVGHDAGAGRGRRLLGGVAITVAVIAGVMTVALLAGGEPETGRGRAGDPKPVVAASKAATVTLDFASTPAGATVVRLADGAVVGQTPCSVKLAGGAVKETFELRLAGHAPVRRDVSLAKDAMVMASLAAVGPMPLPAGEAGTAELPVAGPPAKGAKRSKGSGTAKSASKKAPESPGTGGTDDRGATLDPF